MAQCSHGGEGTDGQGFTIQMGPSMDSTPVVLVNQTLQLHLLGVRVFSVIGSDIVNMLFVSPGPNFMQFIHRFTGVIHLGRDELNTPFLEDFFSHPQGRFYRWYPNIKGQLNEYLYYLGWGQSHI